MTRRGHGSGVAQRSALETALAAVEAYGKALAARAPRRAPAAVEAAPEETLAPAAGAPAPRGDAED